MQDKNGKRQKTAQINTNMLTHTTDLLDSIQNVHRHSATTKQSQNCPAAYAGPPSSIVSSSSLLSLAARTVSHLLVALSRTYLTLFLSLFFCLDAPSLFIWIPLLKPKKLAVSWAAAGPKLNSLMAVKTAKRTRRRDANLSLAQRAQMRLWRHSFEFWVLPATHLLSSWTSVSLS